MLTHANTLARCPLEKQGDGLNSTRCLDEFRSFVASDSFPCIGAKAAFNSSAYSLASYEELASGGATIELASDLRAFVESELRRMNKYATFVAIFRGPRSLTEEAFEGLLWSQLQRLHEIDKETHGWDPSVSSDPSDRHFSFSFAGNALYVVGLHQSSSRLSRRFSWPALVFNPHKQFQRLREEGNWEKMQATIRKRDLRLQGSVNPMLANFGDKSEAGQYSGRVTDLDWTPAFKTENTTAEPKCPFRS